MLNFKNELAATKHKHRGGFIKNLEARWNQNKLVNDTFAARPTKVKMREDYAKNRLAVTEGLLNPITSVEDCQLLFACACGTMLGFRGNQLCG
jgi:hypothetical protein